MDLGSLRIFLAVAEEGSVSRAAERLHYVQSNVTTRLRRLEEDLGTALFIRTGRGMVATSAGKSLQGYARQILRTVEEARQAVSGAARPQGPLAIGAIDTVAAVHLPQVLARYHRQYPEVKIDLQTGASQELVRQVLNYDIEGALVGGPVANSEIVQQEVYVEEMVLVTAPGEPAPAAGNFDTILVFRPGCSCRNRLEQWLREEGLTPIKLMEFGTLDAILGCVGAGMGITMLPRSFVERGPFVSLVQVHTVGGPFARVPTMFIHRQDLAPSPALSALLELFQPQRSTVDSPA
ncbi:MAG: LysR family transcriptional regulator [Syntrophotaleaceae bacterium]